MVCCSECGLKCVETISDYLNSNALTYIAITGDNFCEGAWKGFLVSVKHLLEFRFSMFVTWCFVFMLQGIIIVFNVITGMFVMYDITGSGYAT